MNRQRWYCILSAAEPSVFHFWIFLTAITKMKAEWQRWLILTRDTAGSQRTTRRKNKRMKREGLIYVLFYIQCIWNYVFFWRLLQAQKWQWGIIYPQEKWQGQHFKVKFNVSVEWSNKNCASHSSVLPLITEYTIYQNLYILYLASSHYILYSTSLPIVFAHFFSNPSLGYFGFLYLEWDCTMRNNKIPMALFPWCIDDHAEINRYI